MNYENKRELIKARKSNARLYPIYKMCSWDLLFYYAISFIFLTQTKGFSPAIIMLTDSIYPVFKIIFNVPCTCIVDKLGKRNSLIFANIFLVLYLIILIFTNGTIYLIIAYSVMAFAFAIKRIAESNLLYDSLTHKKGKSMFTKIEALGARNYYFLDGISSVVTGFLFVINGYIPMFVSLGFVIIAILLSMKFKEIVPIRNNKEDTLKSRVKNYIGELKCAFKFIIHSNRLKSLMLFTIFFDGLIYSSYTLRETLLSQILPSQYFALILAIFTIVSGIFTSFQEKIHNKFRNRALTFLVLTYVPTFILIGLLYKYDLGYLSIIPILVLYAVQYMLQAPYYTLSSKYTKSFTSTKMRNKISASFELISSLSQFIVAFIISFLIGATTIANNFIIVGIVFIIIMAIVLLFMRDKFGLKPEQYSKSDIQVLGKEQKGN